MLDDVFTVPGIGMFTFQSSVCEYVCTTFPACARKLTRKGVYWRSAEHAQDLPHVVIPLTIQRVYTGLAEDQEVNFSLYHCGEIAEDGQNTNYLGCNRMLKSFLLGLLRQIPGHERNVIHVSIGSEDISLQICLYQYQDSLIDFTDLDVWRILEEALEGIEG